MSDAFDHGSIEPRPAIVTSHARVVTAYGEVSAAVTCIDVDWKRWVGTYLVRIVNSSDLVLYARLRAGQTGGGMSVRSFCVYEHTMPIPIPASGVPASIDIEGTGLTFSVDVPMPDRGPAPHERGTSTGTIRS